MHVQMIRRTTAALLASIALVGGALGGAPAAQADVLSQRDGDDSAIGADIMRVRVGHDDALVVRVSLDRLRVTKRRVLQGMNVHVDLRPRHEGPELVVESGLWSRGDHLVARTRGWGPGDVVECHSSLRTDPERDLAVLRLGSDCLPARHPRARVAVVAYERGADDESRWVSDWMTDRRAFTPWVARG